MERELTNDEINKLCSYMRVIDLMKKNQQILDENSEFKSNYDILCENVNQIMECISDKQRDEILEIHRLQLLKIAKKTR